METKCNSQSEKGESKKERFIIRTQFTPGYKGNHDSIQGGVSLTVPDMSLTIPQLLQNHTRGIVSDVREYNAQYFDTEIPHLIDRTELDEYTEALNKRRDEVTEALEQSRQRRLKELENETSKEDPNPKAD